MYESMYVGMYVYVYVCSYIHMCIYIYPALSGPRPLDEAGFELQAAKQGECGLTVGYFRTAVGFGGCLGDLVKYRSL